MQVASENARLHCHLQPVVPFSVAAFLLLLYFLWALDPQSQCIIIECGSNRIGETERGESAWGLFVKNLLRNFRKRPLGFLHTPNFDFLCYPRRHYGHKAPILLASTAKLIMWAIRDDAKGGRENGQTPDRCTTCMLQILAPYFFLLSHRFLLVRRLLLSQCCSSVETTEGSDKNGRLKHFKFAAFGGHVSPALGWRRAATSHGHTICANGEAGGP